MNHKVIIVGTHTTETRGGISTALAGYQDGLNQLEVEYIRVNSHSDIRGRLSTWIIAWWQVLLLAMRYRSRAIFWFHCGPWFSMLRKVSFAIPARLFGCKTIAHMHSPTLHSYIEHKHGKYLLKLFFAPFNCVIALTPWWKARLVSFGIKKPIDVCANPVSEDVLSVANKALSVPGCASEKAEKIVILSMARLIEGKGVEHVIDALALLPECYQLNIAGEGPLKQQLIDRVTLLKLQNRVTFLGWVEASQKQNLLNSADIFCLPSKYDSFGVVFIEAMAFNLPVIACDWGPISDVVTSDVGMLAPYGESTTIATQIEQLVKRREDYSLNGPKRIIANYSSSICCHKVMQVFDRLMSGH
ncbi:Glycosyltransferase-like protein [Shewanella sediminis HAW-EB3]|uniref:Glycosyltransferase-like protein n=1 Tax=Shewanella sediminis (strain HAW-EB3) TaxID=425104 RepID=A8FXL2_SHESH|nr:glycosyltransferase family 4 protein [Shewanella sediminis]ABV37585.1 Glycosyltransferase-like protein [Shewanella sediminis HAW-EB3]